MIGPQFQTKRCLGAATTQDTHCRLAIGKNNIVNDEGEGDKIHSFPGRLDNYQPSSLPKLRRDALSVQR
jgi:hypothetical protein